MSAATGLQYGPHRVHWPYWLGFSGEMCRFGAMVLEQIPLSERPPQASDWYHDFRGMYSMGDEL